MSDRFGVALMLMLLCAAALGTAEIFAGTVDVATGSEKIGIHSTGHYLEWKGKPVLLIGDSLTQGWMECGVNFDQRAYVDALASRGMNLVMLWSYIGTSAPKQTEDARIGYDAPEIWPWQGSPDAKDFDLTSLNQAYFDRLKALVSYAETKGVAVLITIHDGWPKRRFGYHPFNHELGNGPLTDRTQYVELADYDNEMPAAYDASWTPLQKNQYFQERLCDKLITELASSPNVIYEMFNEGDWYDHEKRRNHEQHFLAFFRARCDNLLLSNSDHIYGDDPHNDAKTDVVTRHGGWTGVFGAFQEGFDTSPVKPYLQSEPVPSWTGDEAFLETIRKGMWEVTMAGAGWASQNDTSFGWDPNAAMAEQASMRDKAYDYAGYCAKFWNASGVGLAQMQPRATLSSTGICTADEGVEYAVYSPEGGSFTVDLSAAAGKTLAVRWYNPQTGQFQSAPDVSGTTAPQSFAPPFTGDAVLHLKATNAPAEI